MNVSEFYSEIGRKLGDPDNDRWSQSVLLTRMNRSQTKVLVLTNSVKTKETLTPVAATDTVQLDTDVIDIIRVDIQRTNGSWFKLRGYLRDQLDFEDPNWQQRQDGEPELYWWDGTNQQLNLVPAPDSDNAIASGLRVWEIQKPADMAAVGDQPFGSNAAMIPYHGAIVHDVVADCFQDDGTPEALAKSRFHRSGLMSNPGEFEREIMRINSKFDIPEDIPARLLWRPQGGRASNGGGSWSKESPFG
jgi:hypothetical protein